MKFYPLLIHENINMTLLSCQLVVLIAIIKWMIGNTCHMLCPMVHKKCTCVAHTVHKDDTGMRADVAHKATRLRSYAAHDDVGMCA